MFLYRKFFLAYLDPFGFLSGDYEDGGSGKYQHN